LIFAPMICTTSWHPWKERNGNVFEGK
jgi:hypothetical protein